MIPVFPAFMAVASKEESGSSLALAADDKTEIPLCVVNPIKFVAQPTENENVAFYPGEFDVTYLVLRWTSNILPLSS